ncbi:hypothetical protein [Alphaentomopoxvirus acuprea]|uniref:Uncharacterized protein n=1 Tax=Alphaentomopoxvirus acuprea TaxID=62099 RepID=W6JPN0_9POXV|nr:hypothetical protein BA82_gp204 [Anomala cuprea entomopoxvirus]BAO49564.1 hypothetical protein [Anomala cuprea entomopoxvirus]
MIYTISSNLVISKYVDRSLFLNNKELVDEILTSFIIQNKFKYKYHKNILIIMIANFI